MLEINGAMGEGGGSVLRFSLALASVKSEPIRVYNIRANRPNPGLANQHLSVVEALQDLTEAKVEGAELRSEEVVFSPGSAKGKDIHVNVGTAGSTTLILQSVMVPAAFADGSVSLEIIGGTDNPFAPPIDYMENMTLPMLKKMGYRGRIECIRRGHYPKGGGKIKAEIQPIEELQPLNLTTPGEIEVVSGRSHCVKLPEHIAERQAKAAEERLSEAGYEAEVEIESYKKSEDPHLGPGTGVVLWAETENGAILGSSSLGKKGKPAEKVGKEAAEKLIQQLKKGKAVDQYLTDQLVPYFALASGESKISSTKITSHTMTNIKLVEKILNTETEVRGSQGKRGILVVKGSKA